MKRIEIMAQILSEVSERPVSEVREGLELFAASHPSPQFHEELSEAEAEKLLKELRQEKSGIAAWLVQGARLVGLNHGNA